MTGDVRVAEFKAVMSQLVGAVSIVAVGSPAGPSGWRGMTATAVCSLSPEPPSLIACLNRSSGTYSQLRHEMMFSVNVLATRHMEVARTFAGYYGLFGGARFHSAGWTLGSMPVPILGDALAAFECRVSQSMEYGTHAVLIGSIESMHLAAADSEPLVYHGRLFRELGPMLGAMEGTMA